MSNTPEDFGPLDPEELKRMLQAMFDDAEPDPEMLAKLSKLSGGTQIQGLLNHIRRASSSNASGIDRGAIVDTALSALREFKARDLADTGNSENTEEVLGAQTIAFSQGELEAQLQTAFSLAPLWLDEVTEMPAPTDLPIMLSREMWVHHTAEIWAKLAEPVADSMGKAMGNSLREAIPDEIGEKFSGISGIFTSVTSSMFAVQLGTVVARLAREVLTGGDIGIPLFTDSGRTGGVLLAENITEFASSLGHSAADVALFFTVRELAYARLFRGAKWLGPHILSAIDDYARGIEIDTSQIISLGDGIDPSNPEQLQEVLESGQLIPPRTPLQDTALERLELLLALVEGWVDHITEQAAFRLPNAAGLAEMVRRRRATGGAAEHAFQTLVGMRLRPARLREAARAWGLVLERGSAKIRDGLWEHPDVLPSAVELEKPARLLERLNIAGIEPEEPEIDFDAELRKLIDGDDVTGTES